MQSQFQFIFANVLAVIFFGHEIDAGTHSGDLAIIVQLKYGIDNP